MAWEELREKVGDDEEEVEAEAVSELGDARSESGIGNNCAPCVLASGITVSPWRMALVRSMSQFAINNPAHCFAWSRYRSL